MDLSPPVCRDPRPVARGPGNPCRLFRAHANEKLIPRVAKRGLDLLDLLWCIGGGPGGGQHQKRRASFFTAFDILQPPKQQVRRRQPETIRQPANQRAASQTDAEGGIQASGGSAGRLIPHWHTTVSGGPTDGPPAGAADSLDSPPDAALLCAYSNQIS